MRVVMVPGFSLTASSWQSVATMLDTEHVAIDVPEDGDFVARELKVFEFLDLRHEKSPRHRCQDFPQFNLHLWFIQQPQKLGPVGF